MQMKISISNLCWNNKSIIEASGILRIAGTEGIEIALTAIWPNLNEVKSAEVKKLRQHFDRLDLKVSGIQSLLYGQADLQLFDRSSWTNLRNHLELNFAIGQDLGAEVAVFGSPRNRIKSKLSKEEADEIAAEFFLSLTPTLNAHNIKLTLEPNAMEYGADYILTYEDSLELSRRINDPNIAPQIDTGSLWMNGENPKDSFTFGNPHHIHISAPNMREVPGDLGFEDFLKCVISNQYDGWIVIEFFNKPLDVSKKAVEWLRDTVDRIKDAKH